MRVTKNSILEAEVYSGPDAKGVEVPMKKIFMLAAVLSATISMPLLAQEEFLERFGTIRYDSLSAYSLGDGVSYDDLSGPQGNCIDLANSTVNQDVTSGAVSTEAQIDIITSVEELETSLKRSLAIEASAKGGLSGVFDASVSGSLLDDYAGIASAQSSSLVLRILLHSDRGRDWLDYKLKDEFETLVDGSADDQSRFVEICGTHFIRAIQRETSIEILLTVSDLSSSSKETLKREAKASSEGSGTFSNGLKIGGKGGVTSALERFERRASQLGRVSISMRGRGTPVLDAIPPLIYKTDGSPENINAYLTKASEFTAELSGGQGTPSYMILQRYAKLPDEAFNLERYIHVERGLEALLQLNSTIANYERLQSSDVEFFNAHVQEQLASAIALRSRVSDILRDCIRASECGVAYPSIPLPVTKDNALRDGRLVAICGRNLKGELDGRGVSAMSDIAIVWRGEIAFPNYLSLDQVRAFTLSQSGTRVELSEFRAARDFSVDPKVLRSETNPDGKGPGRAITQIINEKLRETDVLNGGEVNVGFLNQHRDGYSNLTFGITLRDLKGNTYDQILGRPDMSQCLISS